HDAIVSKTIQPFLGKSDGEKEKIKMQQKFNEDAMREYYDLMPGADALLILNYDKNGVKNYIGGNTFMEMCWAYGMRKKIYLLNQIPSIPYYQTEIHAMKPIIINNDLNKIK
ncbi:MAG: hypothetical protein Q8P20_08595, partial [bacterium]|nr:hypothetical protein [bacterium]